MPIEPILSVPASRGVEAVEIALKIVLVIFSLGLIGTVLLQRGKSAGLSGAISGGAEHLFGKQKARGLDLFLQRLTIVLAVGFFVLSLVVAYVVSV
nr:preprotein translocase subunit SecG [Cohnella sp. GbtcB17]